MNKIVFPIVGIVALIGIFTFTVSCSKDEQPAEPQNQVSEAAPLAPHELAKRPNQRTYQRRLQHGVKPVAI